jgi:hypothetical protein
VELPDISKLLPPILLGFGGVMPLLISKTPFVVRESLKMLMAVIFVLIVWASYLTAYIGFSRWTYHYGITLTLLIVSVILFIIIYFILRPNEQSDSSPRVWTFLMYAAAISILAAGAANYVGPKDFVVVDLRITSPDGTLTMPIVEVGYMNGVNGVDKYILTSTPQRGDFSSILMQKSLFVSLSTLKVKINTTRWSGAKLQDKYDVDRAHFRQTLDPGLTERYSTTLTAQLAGEHESASLHR